MALLQFSIIISCYNREKEIARCLSGCLNQTYTGPYEIILVDDASTDQSVSVVESFASDRVVVVRHSVNQGISAARDSGVRKASGEWIITLDSDHSLLRHALENLYGRTSSCSDDIGVVGSRYRWDTGIITPAFVPDDVIDYEGRMRWVDAEGGTDYLCCARRCLYDDVRWPRERRGWHDTLFQLNLARRTKAAIGPDVIALEFTDATNSETRARRSNRVYALLSMANDMAWHFDEVLALHGDALQRWGPIHYRLYLRDAAKYHFLAGHRREGARRIIQYLEMSPRSATGWLIALAGTIGPKTLAWANAAKHG